MGELRLQALVNDFGKPFLVLAGMLIFGLMVLLISFLLDPSTPSAASQPPSGVLVSEATFVRRQKPGLFFNDDFCIVSGTIRNQGGLGRVTVTVTVRERDREPLVQAKVFLMSPAESLNFAFEFDVGDYSKIYELPEVTIH